MRVATARRIVPVAVLYSGRIGVAALGLVILPWLSKIMPADQFGLATTVLALQSLAVVLDLGLSVTIAREFPVIARAHEHLDLMRRSEKALLLIYSILATLVFIFSYFGFLPISPSTSLLICLSLLLIVWQNIIIVAFISRQRFIASTMIQFISLLLRHGCSLVFVIVFGGTLQVFVLGQLCGTTIVLVTSRLAFVHIHRSDASERVDPPRKSGATSVAVMVYTIAGACAMQLDKILLSAFSSPANTGPYFLASTLSLVPITFLASPVSQFVQPKLIACVAAHRYDEARSWVTRLTVAIIVLAVLPGIGIGLLSPWLVPFWLQGSAHQLAVSQYTTLLMPGASIGALGLVPAIVLIARRDYRGMAAISSALAVLVLTTTAVLAMNNAITGVCIAYAVYHALAAAALWWRASRIEPWFGKPFAISSRIANGDSAPSRSSVPLNLNNW